VRDQQSFRVFAVYIGGRLPNHKLLGLLAKDTLFADDFSEREPLGWVFDYFICFFFVRQLIKFQVFNIFRLSLEKEARLIKR